MRRGETRAFRVVPVPLERVWGGRRIATDLGRSLPPRKRIGESWEVADVADVSTPIATGEYAGRPLRDVVGGPFPLLVKWIDAREDLSLQVHPSDRVARRLAGGARGKTEAWLVLHAEPRARLVLGLRPGVTRRALEAACRAGHPKPLLREVRVRAGDVVYSPAGTVHAIGGGVFLLEVQQPSDTTYRLHDWGRVGLDGKPRPLHFDEGIRAAKPGTAGARVVGRYDTAPRGRLRRLLSSRAFVLDAMRVRTPIAVAPPPTVEVWTVMAGAGVVEAGGESSSASLGDCVVVVGGRGRVTWRSSDPRRDVTLLRARPGRAAARGE